LQSTETFEKYIRYEEERESIDVIDHFDQLTLNEANAESDSEEDAEFECSHIDKLRG
jgi:hypothetical protein